MAFLKHGRTLFISRAQSRLRLLLFLSAFHLASSLAAAQTATPSESQVKAIFIYKFCLYIEWPPKTFADPDSPLTIGIVDADQIASELEALSKTRTISGRPLAVHRIDDKSSLDNLQLLFIAQTQENRLERWITRTKSHPLLVVTETPSGLDSGSSINFAVQDDRVRFDVGLAAAQRQGLKLSAQLLQVARAVRGGETP